MELLLSAILVVLMLCLVKLYGISSSLKNIYLNLSSMHGLISDIRYQPGLDVEDVHTMLGSIENSLELIQTNTDDS